VTDSITIANNAIVSNAATVRTYCMSIETPNAKVLYNTMVNVAGAGGANIALILTGNNCTVLNNIILEFSSASYVAFDQGFSGQAQNLVSDHNIIFLPEGHGASGLVRSNGTTFTSLAGYQAGTGLDSHSVSKSISFADGFHLDTCQAQDPDLNAIPVPGISVDFDGGQRDSVKPFKGADESVRIPFDMFADGFRVGLPGPPLSLAAGDFFDNDNDDDIVVPTYDNRQVLLFRNQRPARSFVQAGSLPTSVQPTVIKLFDFDRDGNLDLIVGGDEPALDVFWGDPSGGFGSRVTVPTFGRVRSLEPEPFNQNQFPIIWITEDNGFLPTTGFLGYIQNLGGRQLCHEIKHRQGPPPSFFYIPDTIQTPMTDLAVGNIDTSSYNEVVALGSGPLVAFHGLHGVFLAGFPCNESAYDGFYNQHQFGTASYVGHSSSIVLGDFDGDGDNDLLTTSASENTCVLIRNQGNLNFSVESIPAERSRGIVALDYENDGDLDFVTTNRTLYDRGITVFLNDGLGSFTAKPNCFFPFASGFPNGIIASDFDGDNKTDIAIASSFDSLFVLYNLGGFNGTTGVEERPQQQVPTEVSLSQNYPNPFNPSTTIRYHVPVASNVSLRIYNILGQEVATLLDEGQPPGSHVVRWNGQNTSGQQVSSGVYFYRVEVKPVGEQSPFAGVKKMILIR